jgi:hypothetical protein
MLAHDDKPAPAKRRQCHRRHRLDGWGELYAFCVAPGGDGLAATAAPAIDGPGTHAVFRLVWLSIGLLLATGLMMLLATGLMMLLGIGMKQAPVGWHFMLGIGLLMFAVFGHLYFGPFWRLRAAVAAADWQRAGQSSSCCGNTCQRSARW